MQKLRRLLLGTLTVFLALIPVALIWIWFFYEAQRQNKWIATAVCGLAAAAGFLLWVLIGSRWSARVRWSIFAGTIALILFCRFGLRISGVSGDLVPIVEWRWKKPRVIEVVRSSSKPAPKTPTELAPVLLTNSYPQFLGPQRDGVLAGPALTSDWQKTPPRELWRQSVGAAWSGFAIQEGKAITQEQRGGDELVVAYDLLSGAILWSHTNQSRYATTIAGEGPRATPTIAGGRVYTLGGAGVLNCLDLQTGQMLWTKDTLQEHGARVPEWGVACSPLVTERSVIVTVGGRGASLVAYDKDSGAVLWASGQDDVHWSSPVRVTLHGVPQILIFSANVSAYDEPTGRSLWQYPWRNPYPHVSVPLVLSSNRVLVSQGYGTGSELLQISHTENRWRAERIWKSIRLKSKFANLFEVNGFLYGLDDGALVCLDAGTGELKWKGDRFGHGQMILVAGQLLILAENGDIVLVAPDPAEQRERTRFKVLRSKTWNPPALAGDLLVVRNDHEAVCLRLPLAR